MVCILQVVICFADSDCQTLKSPESAVGLILHCYLRTLVSICSQLVEGPGLTICADDGVIRD